MLEKTEGNISCGIFVDLQKAFVNQLLNMTTMVFVAWQIIGLN